MTLDELFELAESEGLRLSGLMELHKVDGRHYWWAEWTRHSPEGTYGSACARGPSALAALLEARRLANERQTYALEALRKFKEQPLSLEHLNLKEERLAPPTLSDEDFFSLLGEP